MADLMQVLASVLNIQKLPADVEKNLTEQEITLDNIVYLEESDLKELGFLMGPRKVVMGWIRSRQMVQSAELPPSSPSPSSSSSSSTALHAVSPTTPRNAVLPDNRASIFKNLAVDELITRTGTAAFNGQAIVQKLKNGEIYTRQERIFFVKTVAKYLMNNCKTQDKPSREEKCDMAKSVCDTFPILKDPVTGGYGEFYDPKAHTGFLEYYIRCRRSRNAAIPTTLHRTIPRRLHDSDSTTEDSEAVRSLRERRATATNSSELLVLMGTTREQRRQWIADESPSITEILQKYPRFQDIGNAIVEEFHALKPDAQLLSVEWPQYRLKILKVAEYKPTAASLLDGYSEDIEDEDLKSEIAFKCLVALLPTPPKRGVKTAKLSPACAVDQLFMDFEATTADDAVAGMRSHGILQPCLFRLRNDRGCNYYIKTDNTSIPLPGASCFSEAVQQLVMAFWVFHVKYPDNLRNFYQFLEHVIGIGRQTLSPIVRDFLRELSAIQ